MKRLLAIAFLVVSIFRCKPRKMGKLLLIGSTGAVGLAVARRALSQSQSNEITIFVRDRTKLAKLLPTDLLDKAQVSSLSCELNGHGQTGLWCSKHIVAGRRG